MDMATSAEVVEKLARELEQLKLLELAKNSKDLADFIKKLEAVIAAK